MLPPMTLIPCESWSPAEFRRAAMAVYVRRLLATAGGSVTRAAQLAGCTRRNVRHLAAQYGVPIEEYRR